VIVLCGIYPQKLKTYVHIKKKKTVHGYLFITAQIWKQPKHLLVGELGKRLYTLRMEYYAVLKRNEEM
jgi:hypothetical protein